MRFILNYILVLIISACSNIKKINHQSVEVFGKDQYVKPKIDEHEARDVYGPTFDQDVESKQIKRDPIIGAIFSPALSASYRYIGFLKALEEKDLNINLIYTKGFSASFISSYAAYKSVSKVEWLIFNRFGTEEESLKIYSEEWSKKWKNAIAKHFEEIKIEQTKIPIFIPYVQNNTSELIFSNREKISTALVRQMQFEGMKMREVANSINPYKKLKTLGADIIIYVDALGDNFRIDNPDFKKIYEKIQMDKINQNSDDIITVDLSEDKENLENEVNHNLMIKEGYDKSQLYIQEIVNRITDWKK